MEEKKIEKEECFIIMPISDQIGYEKGHFTHVYKNIIKPACEQAGLMPIRADDVQETKLIHLDILQRLITSPIAICDLSSRNPNVLFELGIRQAFDKPVVLIQEEGTEPIFDIAGLKYITYSQKMKYHEVIASQTELQISIKATMKAAKEPDNANSIVKLLSLSAATLPKTTENDKGTIELSILRSEIKEIKKILLLGQPSSQDKFLDLISYEYDFVKSNHKVSLEKKVEKFKHLLKQININMKIIEDSYRAEVLVYRLMKSIDECNFDIHNRDIDGD